MLFVPLSCSCSSSSAASLTDGATTLSGLHAAFPSPCISTDELQKNNFYHCQFYCKPIAGIVHCLESFCDFDNWVTITKIKLDSSKAQKNGCENASIVCFVSLEVFKARIFHNEMKMKVKAVSTESYLQSVKHSTHENFLVLMHHYFFLKHNHWNR